MVTKEAKFLWLTSLECLIFICGTKRTKALNKIGRITSQKCRASKALFPQHSFGKLIFPLKYPPLL